MLNQANLIYLADEHGLTDQQREVLVLRIIEKKGYRQIAKELETSENACQKCMGEVYKKFDITGDTRGKERRLLLKIKSISDRQKLVSLSSPEVIRKLDSLSQAIEEEKEFDAKIDEVSKIIPVLIDSAATTSNRSRVEVSQEILESLKASYLKTIKIPLPPVIEINLQFILTENAIARSLFAFIARTCQQIQLENHSPAKTIIIQAIREIMSDSSHKNDFQNDFQKAPSATLRKFCLEQILKLSSQGLGEESSQERINEECLIKNMKVIRYVLDELENKNIENNQIYFNLLNLRYYEGLSYEQIAREWTEVFPELKQKKYVEDKIKYLQKIENTTLKYLRDEFHKFLRSESLEDILKKVKQTKIIASKDPEVKEKIELYRKIASYKTLNNSNIQYLQLILADSIRTPIIDFWLNEIDHFIFHEREDLKSSGDYKQFEAQQKNELIKEIKKIRNEVFVLDQEPTITIGNWVANFRVYCSQHESAQAEVTLWNPKNNEQYTGLASSNGSIDALCQALNQAVNRAIQSCNYVLYWVNLQNLLNLENLKSGIDARVSATIILQCGADFYIGKETHIDSIKAAFNACVAAINNILENKPTSIKKVAKVTGTETVIIFGEARIQNTIKLLKDEKYKKSPIYAVSSGEIIKWWNSDIGRKFMKTNQEHIAEGNPIQRVFIVEELSDKVKQVMEEQSRNGIEVCYLLKEKAMNLDNFDFKGLASENFLVCDNKFTTRIVVDNQGKETDGSISWRKDNILTNKERFEMIWKNALCWNATPTE